MTELVQTVELAAVTLARVAPWLLLGFLLAGIARELIPAGAVRRHLGGGGVRPVLVAAGVGLPLPLCSCSVIPAAVELRRQGAGRGATVSFLVATPEVGFGSILVSFATLHPLMAVFRPLAALLTAVLCGLLVGQERPAGASSAPAPGPGAGGGEAPSSLALRLGRGVRYAFTDLFRDVALWLVPAVVLAGALMAWVDPAAVAARLPSPPMQMLALALLGIPLYVCATSATPLAAAMILAGFSPGAALVFLLTGPASNVATLLAVKRTLGTRTLGLYLAGLLATSLAMGLSLDALLSWRGIDAALGTFDPRHEGTGWLGWASAAVMLLLVARTLLARWGRWGRGEGGGRGGLRDPGTGEGRRAG